MPPALPGCWQRQALAQAVPSSAERAETKQLRAHSTVFASLEEARLEVACHLDIYFNLDRRHSALGYRSPQTKHI
jgi:transposase InsO family protein